MISHEFRNPLSTIINSTELLAHQEYQLNEAKKHEYINHIQAAVNQLNQLLNDVLIIGKAEESKIKFNLVPLDLEKFCQDLVAEMQLSVGNKHTISFINRFYCQKLENSPVSPNSQSQADQAQLPYFDEKLLRQILTNLLSNAIKYSPQGGMINFDLFWEKEEVIFRIQDEGIGIPIADQEELFNSFHRGSNVGKIPGTGLGLAVVKHYVELLGGEIAFASKVGVGTTFIVTLPFQNKREMSE
jgi:signal transduction histidine kinase